VIAAPLYIHALIASAGLWLAIRAHRSKLLRVYFGFVVVAALAGIPLLNATGTEAYRLAFFAVELAHNSLLIGLALIIVADLAPEKWGIAAGVFWLSLVVIGIAHNIPSLTTASLLDSSVAAEFGAGGMLLVLVLIPGIRWTRAHTFAAAGITLVILGQALPELQWLNTLEPLKMAQQLGDVPGLIALALSSLQNKAVADLVMPA